MLTANLLVLSVALPTLIGTLTDANLTSVSTSGLIHGQVVANTAPPDDEQLHRGSGRCTTPCS